MSPIQYKENTIQNNNNNKGGVGGVVALYRKYIAATLGVSETAIASSSVEKKVIDKDWQSVREIVEDIAAQRRAKAERGALDDPNALIGAMFNKIAELAALEKIPSEAELQERLFAKPEPVAQKAAGTSSPDALWKRFAEEARPDEAATAALKADFIDMFGRIAQPMRCERHFKILLDTLKDARTKDAPLVETVRAFLIDLRGKTVK